MTVTQGMFSYLPPLTDVEIAEQVQYALDRGWPVSIEHTDDPHPRNVYWHMWGQPLFDLRDAAGVMEEVRACRAAHPDHYVKVNAFDASRGWETVRLSFIVQRPADEAGFELEREEGPGRTIHYRLRRAAGG